MLNEYLLKIYIMKLRLLLILLIVFPCLSKAQTKNEILMYACQFLAGSADGVNQAVVHHYLGKGNAFWDFEASWKNKYKDYDNGDYRPAFFGAKSFAVAATDGYHLTRCIDRVFTLASVGFALDEKNNWKSITKKVLVSALVNRAGFMLTYNVIYHRDTY